MSKIFKDSSLVHLAFFMLAVLAAADPRNIDSGWEIPSEGYVDQPYVVVLADGAWLCTLTTGPAEEGNHQQHVVATRSEDKGKTWSPLIDIEPHGPPEASWVMPLLVPSGRVYAFYVYNADNLREVIASTDYARKRVDTLGHYMFRYSDDGGRTWSPERHDVPIRTFEIDRQNPYQGDVQFFWGVGKPTIHGGAAYIGLAKVGSFGQGFIERSEGFFLRSPNILNEPDPATIQWETLPDGDVGLRAPKGPIAEEHNLVELSTGALYCTYRTIDGHPCHAYSNDDGRTWTPPAYMRYSPDGRMLKNPRAANFVRRFSNGKYLYWFHNHGGTSYEGRNPTWISGGAEKGGFIHWSEPEIVLYADDPKLRMSYPDFIEDGGAVYITETQKSTARVHAIDARLLDALWTQHESAAVTRDGLVLELHPQDLARSTMREVALTSDRGFAVELALTLAEGIADQPLIETGDDAGNGWALSWHAREGFRFTLDSANGTWTCESDPLPEHAQGWQHVVVNVDEQARIVTFVLNGRLYDGLELRPQGWYRIPPEFLPLPNARRLGMVPPAMGQWHKLRVYDRYLLSSEAVGNFRVQQVVATTGTDDDD